MLKVPNSSSQVPLPALTIKSGTMMLKVPAGDSTPKV
jgi:hypothetical protein